MASAFGSMLRAERIREAAVPVSGLASCPSPFAFDMSCVEVSLGRPKREDSSRSEVPSAKTVSIQRWRVRACDRRVRCSRCRVVASDGLVCGGSHYGVEAVLRSRAGRRVMYITARALTGSPALTLAKRNSEGLRDAVSH